MTFGPNHFEDAQNLINFIANDVLGEGMHDHSLRKAIANHIHAQDISESHPAFVAFREKQTFNADIRLKRIFDEHSSGEIEDLNTTLKTHIVHCFWDGIRKDAGALLLSLDPDMSESKAQIMSNSSDPRQKVHYKIFGTLRNHINKYRELFGSDDTGETKTDFNQALNYMEETILAEMERLFGQEFIQETPNASSDPVIRFQEKWNDTARELVDWSKIEGDMVETPSKVPGKPPKMRPINSFGFEGLRFDAEGLGL